jgi:F-type H+-transporting ATPase subunit gamma
MPSSKEIRGKIKSVENTKKITKAMEMVAASKMRKAQERMRSARPYAEKIGNIAAALAQANPEYRHPFLVKNEKATTSGMVVVTTDKGLCGGLNTNLLRAATTKLRELESAGQKTDVVAIGGKGFGFMNRVGARVVAHATQLGYLAYTKFINTMKQEVVVQQLLPLKADDMVTDKSGHSWDYLYEPDAATVIDELLTRYSEALVFQAVAENMASEQSARMVAMKSATDNAGNLIKELKLVYNKTRQAAITKELSEIVSGAAAVG